MSGPYYDINHPFLTSNMVAGYPFHDHWRGRPLSQYVWIDPNKAGYKPYTNTMKLEVVTPFENNCATYQTSCDIILPSGRCYAKTREIVQQP